MHKKQSKKLPVTYNYINRQSIFRLSILSLTFAFSHSSFAKSNLPPADTPINNPPNVLMERNGVKMDGFQSLAPQSKQERLPSAGETLLNLDIEKTAGTIFNPTTGLFDKVLLRSYQGGQNDPDAMFVAPTITIVPGDTVRTTLNNKLDADDPSCKGMEKMDKDKDHNKPHCFNSTNLHSHGLWISPSGNSDNVLIKVDPGVKFTYEWNIPTDHPAGTFWYHPHLHGSTALQVSSGMAGALIIKGNRLPTTAKNGDIDTLLRQNNGEAYAERLVLFEQIQYACRDAQGKIKTIPSGPNKGNWFCDKEDIGQIENYDQFGPSSWKNSGRYTSINGRVMPTFTAKAGEIERWRLIHAGVRETIKPSFRKASVVDLTKVSATEFSATSTAEKKAFISKHCSGAQATQLSLATDGLTRNRLVAQKQGVLQPGYREDLLMVFPEAGVYCMIDEATTNGTVSGNSEARQILGFVKVEAGAEKINNAPEFIKQSLIASAKKHMPESVRTPVVDQLKANLGLARFVPHPSIAATEVTGHQSLAFNISTTPSLSFDVGNLNSKDMPTNLNPYSPKRIDRDLLLGNVEEWTLKSFFDKEVVSGGGHPFHIHVNPFQIISIKDKKGNEVSGYEAENTSQYARLQGTWKDTLFIASDDHKIVIRTRYQRYIGEFVLHCHILDHEDQGMMQNVRISIPDKTGQPAKAH